MEAISAATISAIEKLDAGKGEGDSGGGGDYIHGLRGGEE